MKLKLVLHAEQNAILFAQRELTNCVLYTWPFMPCTRCTVEIIQSGISLIKTVDEKVTPVVPKPDRIADHKLSREILKEAGVTIVFLDEPELIRGL